MSALLLLYEDAIRVFVDPTSLNGLKLWLDADDASTIMEEDSPGFVSQWDDKSGNGFNVTQGTGSKQPQTGVDTIGGLNTITFDDTDDVLNNTSYIDFSEITLIAVAAFESDDNSAIVEVTNGTVNTGAGLFQQPTPPIGGGIKFVTQTPATVLVLDEDPPPTVIHIFTGTRSTSEAKFFIDGALEDSTSIASGLTNTLNRVDIGQLAGFNSFTLDGFIGEVIIYNKALLDSERVKVETFLSDKWGIPLA